MSVAPLRPMLVPRGFARASISLCILFGAGGCGDDTNALSEEGGGGVGASAGGGGSGGGDPSGGDGGGGTGGDPLGTLIFRETFDGADGDAWPNGWNILGGTEMADIQSNMGRFRPVMQGVDYPLARIGRGDISAQNTEVTARFRFSAVAQQGFGFYARQNGGYLQQSTPTGAGYGAFVSGFEINGISGPHIGVWREDNGDEQMITGAPTPIASDQFYQLRFRVTQQSSSETLLQAKLWQDDQPEPTAWQVEVTDGLAALQASTDGFALDAWVSPGNELTDLVIDDIRIYSND